ncbi:MAG: TatD family hydrolase [Bacteroidales bacterium]|nr:TatD family hydrolase [Bacteroidales bacterium]
MQTPFIDIHTHMPKLDDHLIQIVNLELEAPCPEQGYYSYGIHPWALDNAGFQIETTMKRLEERLQSPNVVALGEAGLDKMHKASFERQMILFERQIALSEALQKPMILHDVRCHNEIIALRKKHKAKQAWILHGFNGTEQDVKQLIGQGISLSVGEALLHPERKIYAAFPAIDLDFLFLETDMAEVGIQKVYESAARILETDIKTLQSRILENFKQIFLDNSQNS